MAGWGLNGYLHAPKDDLKHRVTWRELYSASEAASLGEVIRACRQQSIRFIYALSPGLDIRYSNEAELIQLKRRFEQILDLGGQHFALLFDDIPDGMAAEDLRARGSLASAQSYVANELFRWVRERSSGARFLFCPTQYCGRMREESLGGAEYLPCIGRELFPEIDVLWTGPEIISREITVAHVQEMRSILRRKPLIWDNLHANDYDGRRFYCGPYAGRPPELRTEVSGLLSNPNNEFPLNYIPLRTLAEFVSGEGGWDARKAYLAAMQEWLPRFATVGQPVTLEDLILLGDCYYLPYQEGPEAEALFERVRRLLAKNPAEWGDEAAAFAHRAARLRELCIRLAEVRQRPLFYALSRRVWELREELDLLLRYVESQSGSQAANAACCSDFHLLGTFRGGMVPACKGCSSSNRTELLCPPAATRASRPPTRRPVQHPPHLERLRHSTCPARRPSGRLLCLSENRRLRPGRRTVLPRRPRRSGPDFCRPLSRVRTRTEPDPRRRTRHLRLRAGGVGFARVFRAI
jgi:protein O-GlcNAcase/histone acetyltransferase